MNTDANNFFESCRSSFEREFFGWIESRYNDASSPLVPVIRYVLEGQGKRTRPLFAMLSAQSISHARRGLLPGLATELVHIYSLVHDDLPCMDNDAMRRGRPTAHVVYGDASALLAGDAILADSFALLLDSEQFRDPDASYSPGQRLRMAAELANSSGSRGMCFGQALDLHWTAREGATKQILDRLHEGKTGELLGAACAMGAIGGGADAKTTESFRRFGRKIGLAFQIVDDLMDQNPNTGKTAGKDADAKKLTYLSYYSPEEAHARAKIVTDEAISELANEHYNTDQLVTFATKLLDRTH